MIRHQAFYLSAVIMDGATNDQQVAIILWLEYYYKP